MSDPFEELGYGKDFFNYRGPYHQFISQERLTGHSGVNSSSRSSGAAAAQERDFESEVARAAAAISAADYLLVCAGAGLSADSGLGTYADVASQEAWQTRGLSYGSLCLPSLLEEQPEVALGFWASCANKYAAAEPHEGYAILKKWCFSKDGNAGATAAAAEGSAERQTTGNVAPVISNDSSSGKATEVISLTTNSSSSDSSSSSSSDDRKDSAANSRKSFVYTSNVDGLFLRSGFSPAQVFEVHGTLHGPGAWFCPKCSSESDKSRQEDDGQHNGSDSKVSKSSDCSMKNSADSSNSSLVAAPIQQFPFPVDPVTLELHDKDGATGGTSTLRAEAGVRAAAALTSRTAALAVGHDKAAGEGEEEGGREGQAAASQGMEEQARGSKLSGAWPRCKRCGSRARPSVLMFGDDCPPLVKHLAQREAAYVAWEAKMEDAVSAATSPLLPDSTPAPDPPSSPSSPMAPLPPLARPSPSSIYPSPPSSASSSSFSVSPRVVVLEIGCGLRVPTLRIEAETVYRDVLNKVIRSSRDTAAATTATVTLDLHSSSSSSSPLPRVSFVRINVDFPQVPLPQDAVGDFNNSNDSTNVYALRDAWNAGAVSVRGTALESLRAIDAAIESTRSHS